MERTKAQKRANRRVAAERSTSNLVTGIKGLLLNETLTTTERVNTREALEALEDNLRGLRPHRADGSSNPG